MAGDSGWWLVLSAIDEHKTQVRCSAVCKQWGMLCKTLPKLHIDMESTNINGADRFIRRALCGRSELQELKITYPLRMPPPRESSILSRLRDVSACLKVLHLRTPLGTEYRKIWSRLVEDFPQLQSLTLHAGYLPVQGRLGIVQEHRSLKLITLLGTEGTGSHIEELVNFCPSLEKLWAGPIYGPVHVSSTKLVGIFLNKNSDRAYIDAPNLTSLALFNSGHTTVVNVAELVKMCLGRVSSLDIPLQQLGKLKTLFFSGNNISSIFRILSSANNLKNLMVEGCVLSADELRLKQLVPSQLEHLAVKGALLGSLRASEAFQRESVKDVVELMNWDLTTEEQSNLPTFSLKMVTLDYGYVESVPAAAQLSIIVQLLKCSPQLEELMVTSVGDDALGFLKQVEDPRYHVCGRRCTEPECVRVCLGCGSETVVDSPPKQGQQCVLVRSGRLRLPPEGTRGSRGR